MKLATIIEDWTTNLTGKVCWGVAAGGCVGSAFTFDAGERTRRKRRLTNPNLTEDQRNYVASYALYVQDAAWTLYRDGDATSEVVTSSSDDSAANGPIAVGLQKLVGNRISSCVVDHETNDLIVRFLDCDLRLFVSGRLAGEDTAYSLFLPSAVVSCEASGMELERNLAE